MQPTLLVLAAGLGSRYGGLKQVDPVGPNGEIVLDYSIYDARRAGFGKVIFVIRKDLEQTFRERFDKCAGDGFEIGYVFQHTDDLPANFKTLAGRTKPWGTGHAVLAARNQVTQPFAVINADDFYGPESYRLLHHFLGRQSGPDKSGGRSRYMMVAFKLANTLSPHGTVSRGVCKVNPDSLLQNVEEHSEVEKRPDGLIQGRDAGGLEKKLDGDTLVSMNMWGFTPDLFTRLENHFGQFLERHGRDPAVEFYLPAAIDQMIRNDECEVCVKPSSDAWFGVTYREDRDSVIKCIEQRLAAGIYPHNTLPGTTDFHGLP